MDMPQIGGSYVRQPDTGALTRIDPEQGADAPTDETAPVATTSTEPSPADRDPAPDTDGEEH